MIGYLEQIELFQELSLKTITNIAEFCHTLVMSEGDIVISENDKNNYDLFILISGKVEILSNSNGAANEVALADQKFESFGEISWLLKKPRSATIRCANESELIKIDGTKLMTYLESDPQAGFLVMRQVSMLLSRQLLDTNNLLKQILWNIKI